MTVLSRDDYYFLVGYAQTNMKRTIMAPELATVARRVAYLLTKVNPGESIDGELVGALRSMIDKALAQDRGFGGLSKKDEAGLRQIPL